ncbi:TIGR03899 family protein [uncultured Photobacterium sp.]|uniref:TIGR03899 family protein n=1 Tax=uncultured Photobacterium sp. TaxID=173973 RepID=UPI002629ADAE|nr:TIGR03899 family protein [uncultured Photobacterium sp.]
MNQEKKEVPVDTPAVPAVNTNKEDNSSHIRSSRTRTKDIATQYAIAHLITNDPDRDLAERTTYRLQKETQHQQENLERIFKLAYDSCSDETAGDPDPDWLYHFSCLARNIRNASMQKLWSRILKQEIISPGSTSLKALDTLKNMTQREAQIFHRACILTCHFGNDNSKKLLTSIKARHGGLSLFRSPSTDKLALGNFQLPYSNLLVLMDLGLLLRSELESGEISIESPLAFGYQDTNYLLRPIKKGITLTYYRLSPTGQEIANLLGTRNNESYKESLLELLCKHFIVEQGAGSQINI